MKYFLFSCALVFFVACQSTQDKEKKCPLGEPSPVYSSDYNFVKRHTFTKDGQNSEEQIEFTDGTHLTIRQSGCQKIRQDYTFLIDQATTDSTRFWVEESSRQFRRLASYSEKFYSFNQWADKINEFKSEIRLTEPYKVAPGIAIKIDRIKDLSSTELIVSLLQE